MKTLLFKIAIFSLPFLLWLVLLVLVDPFDFFVVSKLIPAEVKRRTSYKLNSRLWKAVEFQRNPTPNILLGDSRTDQIDAKLISSKMGQNFYNFAHGGGSLAEAISTFHYARKCTELRSVYIGINFNLYNRYNSANLFSGAELIANDYRYYLFNKSVAEGLLYNLLSWQTGRDFKIGSPPMNREAFWKYQLSYAATYSYQRYRYPSTYYEQLKEISAYCRSRNIKLAFIILPTHVDLQQRVADFGLVQAERRFKKDLAELGTLYDFDYPNDWTRERENFSDPFHFKTELMEKIIDEVWGNSRLVARNGEAA